jgi:hypothetical protein
VKRVPALAVAFGLLLFSVDAQAQWIAPARNAMSESKPIIDLRLRTESVDQDGLGRNAAATTLRGRFGFETGKAWNTALLAEADLLRTFGGDYNSTTNGHTAFPVVPDPETHEINRLQLTNGSLPGTTLVLGRQRIVLDDQRFVANVGWRQNEQTFDALRVTNRSIANLTIDVAYLSRVNRVFGRESPVGYYDGDNFVANVAYQMPLGKLTGFAYLLDFDRAPADSSRTLGARFAGERVVRRVKVGYAASWASQEDRANNPLDYSDDFHAAEVTGTIRQWSLGAGVEVLQGDGVKGFATPLATLHKFQGWADKFLTTPPNGIDDRYVTLGYATKGVGVLDSLSATLAWHLFEAERGALDYGSELNLQLQAKWHRLSGILKYADYRADRFATDTRKFWAQVEFVW